MGMSVREKNERHKVGAYYCVSTKKSDHSPFLISRNRATAVAYAKKRQVNAQFRVRVVYVVMDEEIIESTIVWPKIGKSHTRENRPPIAHDGDVERNG
jgi:hypothetical protein